MTLSFRSKPTAALVVALAVLAIWLVNRTWVIDKSTLAFVLTEAIIVVTLVFIGMGINSRPAGVLIDDRNRISLSKFQMVMWTVLVIASLIVIASHNLALGKDDNPMDLTIPTELLAAMGISAASFVSTPIVLSLKKDQPPTPQDADKAQAAAAGTTTGGESAAAFAGKVFARSSPKGAAWIDMLVGEEVGNVTSPDLGKIQQLFISILLVAVYGFSVKNALMRHAAEKITAFPVLSDSFVWLLAVSHASYLAYKAAPHTSTGGSTAAQPEQQNPPQQGDQAQPAGQQQHAGQQGAGSQT